MGNSCDIETGSKSYDKYNMFRPSTSTDIKSDYNLAKLQYQIVELSGVSMDEIKILNVDVGSHDGKAIQMNTIVVGEWNQPKIVFIHGFGNSNALFYTIFKPLMEHYCLILIDMIGCGASSRPENFQKRYRSIDAQEVLDYFMNYIEVWRIKMKLDSFNLIGHSQGGYISGNYALRYPEYVKKLILISPIGIRVAPEYDNNSQIRDGDGMYGDGAGPPQWLQPAISYFWNKRLNVFNIGRIVGEIQSKKVVNTYVTSKYLDLDSYDKQQVCNYLYHILFRNNPPETSIQIMFNSKIQAYHPLGGPDKLGSEDFPIPISFMYGDQDWVKNIDQDSSQKVINANSIKHGKKSNFYIISNSGHNVHADNPSELAEKILQDLNQ